MNELYDPLLLRRRHLVIGRQTEAVPENLRADIGAAALHTGAAVRHDLIYPAGRPAELDKRDLVHSGAELERLLQRLLAQTPGPLKNRLCRVRS